MFPCSHQLLWAEGEGVEPLIWRQRGLAERAMCSGRLLSDNWFKVASRDGSDLLIAVFGLLEVSLTKAEGLFRVGALEQLLFCWLELILAAVDVSVKGV